MIPSSPPIVALEAEVTRLRAALTTVSEERDAREMELRKHWWLNHGHDFGALYGDDGEMQCSACLLDYKRAPFEDVRAMYKLQQLQRGRVV